MVKKQKGIGVLESIFILAFTASMFVLMNHKVVQKKEVDKLDATVEELKYILKTSKAYAIANAVSIPTGTSYLSSNDMSSGGYLPQNSSLTKQYGDISVLVEKTHNPLAIPPVNHRIDTVKLVLPRMTGKNSAIRVDMENYILGRFSVNEIEFQ